VAYRFHLWINLCGFQETLLMNNFIGDRRICLLPQCDVKRLKYDQIIFLRTFCSVQGCNRILTPDRPEAPAGVGSTSCRHPLKDSSSSMAVFGATWAST
jgi:hypothetical protein